MQIEVSFPGGKRVDAHFGPYTIHTDQPLSAGGQATAPTPFNTFLASLATCAGLYVLAFCQQRSLSTEGLRLFQYHEVDRVTGQVTTIRLRIVLPPGFPKKYHAAVVRAAEQCAVKKHLDHPPAFEVEASTETPDTVFSLS